MVRRRKKLVETKKRNDNEESRQQVCFSKRRQGLFNKALELSVLCGAMVGVVVFSNSGKSYSIGHPSVDAVINRFLLALKNPPNAALSSASENTNGRMTDTVRLLCQQYMELQGLVDEEMKRKEILQEAVDKEMGSSRMMQLLTAKISDLGQDDLQELYTQLQAMHGAVNQVMAEIPSSQPQLLPSTDMSVADPSSTKGSIDGFEIYELGGSGNFPNNQNLG